ncbi:hypothetical protein VT06_05225 [Arsukibacterium sp. MJ3]|uniref:hypothetical protein n=1 Tax=Arsukibacterium sp. MJ3 TaxID=1632859 RepID=UPI000627454F|nr:hypothetical protein [Arsukibacterium sp. MJ3]KKO49601.1 hypothetical protein VT06_05225 [Arsukibacterium sp. MJ3]
MFKSIIFAAIMLFSSYGVTANTANTQQVQVDIPQVGIQPIVFYIVNKTNGSTKVCVSSGNICNEIPGTGTVSEDMAFFELSHNNGENFNISLINFLETEYTQDNGMSCRQSSTCGSDNDCTAVLTCKKD